MDKINPNHKIPVCEKCNVAMVYEGTTRRFIPGSAIRVFADIYRCPKCWACNEIHGEKC